MTKRQNSFPPSVLHAPSEDNYFSSQFVHCAITRENQNGKNQRFYFIYQAPIGDEGRRDTVAMVADKQTGKRTSHYRIWDTTRINFDLGINGRDVSSIKSGSLKLNKKSGNYLGKLRRDKSSKEIHGFSIYNSQEEKHQIGAFVYSKTPLIQQMKDGHPPRNVRVAIPQINNDGQMESLAPYLKNRLVECAFNETKTGIFIFRNKEPTFQNGQYRLNFSGRVTRPSVKNVQLVGSMYINDEGKEEEQEEIFLQFGKVGDNRFHLDFKRPFNALQSFALALSAIDL
jgi:hypothetical protein